MRAEIDLVVDEEGKVVPGSPRLVATNNHAFAREVLAVIGDVRYSPAKRGDTPVRQLARYVGKAQFRVVSSATPGSSARRPPPC
jgi:hypothetical protein